MWGSSCGLDAVVVASYCAGLLTPARTRTRRGPRRKRLRQFRLQSVPGRMGGSCLYVGIKLIYDYFSGSFLSIP